MKELYCIRIDLGEAQITILIIIIFNSLILNRNETIYFLIFSTYALQRFAD